MLNLYIINQVLFVITQKTADDYFGTKRIWFSYEQQQLVICFDKYAQTT